jgi:prolipoprotein diacylglyceryltransferase
MQSPAVPLVGAVESDSPAAHAGLQRGDVITKVNEQTINSTHQLVNVLQTDWPRGEQKVALTVMRRGAVAELPPFTPRTLALHPTQIYESISMFLIFLLLLAFYPYRRHYGQVFVLLMLCYAVHRFFNETLRNDTDPVWMNLTLSQVGSLAVFAGGIGLELFLRQYSERVAPAAPATPGDKAAKANA